MEKVIKLFTYVDGINDTPFPNEQEQIVIGTFKYDANRMGAAPSIEAKAMHRLCLDGLWSDKVYAVFNGEKHYVMNTPSSNKNNEDERYEHEIVLKSEREILNHVYFIDAVQGDSGQDQVKSNSSKVQFTGNIQQFVDRLNASLSYSKLGYTAVIDEGITSEEKLVSFEDKYILEALQEIYNVYNLPYYFDGKTIHIGYEQNAIPVPLKYGFDEALLSISKDNANYKVVNRCTGYGSQDNIPYYYPNSTPKGDVKINVTAVSGSGLTSEDFTITDGVKFAEKVSASDKFVAKYINDSKVGNIVSALVKKGASGDFTQPQDGVPVITDFTETDLSYNAYWEVKTEVQVTKKCRLAVDLEAGNPAVLPIGYNWRTQLSVQSEYSYNDGAFTPFSGRINADNTGKYVVLHKYTASVNKSAALPKPEGCVCSYRSVIDNSMSLMWTLDGRKAELSDYGISVNSMDSAKGGDSFMQTVGSIIPFSEYLMPPVYRETKGAERFYNAKNNTYPIPESEGEFYEFEKEYSPNSPEEMIVEFSDIKPTIVGMKNAQGERIDQFIDFAYDQNDSDEFDSEGNYLHPYFFAKIRKTDGDFGFNLFDQANEKQTMEISFTTGTCGSCKFEIGVGEETNKNIVQVDDSGNLIRDEEGNVLWENQAPQDRQNDTRNNEVWIALKKDNSTYTNVMPNVERNLKPSTEDKFVILGITLPQSYITAAEERLKEEIIKYMFDNNMEKFTFSIKFSRIFFMEHPEILEMINENSRVIIEYNGKQHSLYIDEFSYKVQNDSPLPEIEVNLVDTLTIGKNSLEQMISSINQDLMSNISSGDFLKQGLKYFIRKDIDDTAKGKIKFEKGLYSQDDIIIGNDGFIEGLAGRGGIIRKDGRAEMRSLKLWESLDVPEIRFNSVKVFLGVDWQVPGGGVIESVIPDKDEEGNILPSGTCKIKLEEGQIGAVDFDDIAIGIWHFGDGTDAENDSDDGKGNFEFAGFSTAYFRVTEVSYAAREFRYSLRPNHNVHPQPQMNFACYGNFTKEERQTSTYRTRTYTRRLWHQNTWEINKQNVAMQEGDLSNLKVFGLNMKGYSLYVDSVYFTGVIKQVKPDGTPIITANDRGAWVKDTLYDYYDRVSHNGSLWLCVNEEGTNTEPSKSNVDWLLQVEAGAEGGSVDIYSISPSTTSIHVNSDGTYTPAKLSCYVTKRTSDGYEDLLVLPEGLVLKFTYDGRPENIWSGALQFNTSAVKNVITFNLYYNNVVIDKVDIFVIKDGEDGTNGSDGSDGSDGADGESPVIYSLFPSDNVVQVSQKGIYNPQFVSCRLKKVIGESVTIEDTIPAGYSMKYKKDDNAQQAYTINSPIDTSDAVNSISFYLYKGDVYIDAVRIAVLRDGEVGMAGASPRYRGFWNNKKVYVYTDEDRDIVIFGSSKYRVKKKGIVPIGIEPTNTTYWEEASEFEFIAMDTALIDNANIAGFIFRKLGELSDGTPYGELKSQNNDTDGTPMLSMNTRTGKFICRDAVIKGEVNATSGTFTDVVINGSLRSQFDMIEDSVDSDYSDNVIVDTPAGWPTVYSLPLGVNHIGRKLTICAIGEGISSFTIPDSNSYYFYEFGKKKKEMNLRREVVQLIGYGLGSEFYGWIVLSRNYLDVTFGNGDYDKVLAKGYASMRNSLQKYSTYDGSSLKITQSTNKVTIKMPTTWFKSFEEYLVFITPRSSAASGTYLVSPINNYEFEVNYLGSGGGGAFYFEIKRLNF